MESPNLDGLLGKVRAALAGSELLRDVAAVRADGGRALALGGSPVRPLTDEEVDRLERLGNAAEDWSKVLVAEGFDPSRVRRSEFRGEVVLGRFAGKARVGGLGLPAGVVNSTVVDAVVGHDALVRDVRLLANYAVGPGAVLLDCGRVDCDAGTTFGNGAALPVGIECGGRPVRVFAELDVELAAAVARPGRHPGLAGAYSSAVDEYVARAASPRGIVGAGARVQ